MQFETEGSLRAVLITGVYGSGKSSLAAEIADILEKRQLPYALLDLDFLSWFDVGTNSRLTGHQMMLKNLTAVVDNYAEAGVRYFVLAHAIRDETELDDFRSLFPSRLRVVRLVVPLEVIEQRLSADVTSGRQDDLRTAARWLDSSIGVGFEEIAISNDRRIQEVAAEVLEWLEWG